MKFRALDFDYDAEAARRYDSFVVVQVYERDRLFLADVPHKRKKRRQQQDDSSVPSSRKVPRILKTTESLNSESSHQSTLKEALKQRISARVRDPILPILLTDESIIRIIESIRKQASTRRLTNIPWRDYQTFLMHSRAVEASFKLYRRVVVKSHCTGPPSIRHHFERSVIHTVKESTPSVEHNLVTSLPTNALVLYQPPRHLQCLNQALQVAFLLWMQAESTPDRSKNQAPFISENKAVDEENIGTPQQSKSVRAVDAAEADTSFAMINDTKDEPWPECNDTFVFSPFKRLPKEPCLHDERSIGDEMKVQRKKARKEKKQKRRREKKAHRSSSKKQRKAAKLTSPDHATDKQCTTRDDRAKSNKKHCLFDQSGSVRQKTSTSISATSKGRARWIEGPCSADTPKPKNQGENQQSSTHLAAECRIAENFRSDTLDIGGSVALSRRLGRRACLGKRKVDESDSDQHLSDSVKAVSQKRRRENADVDPSDQPIQSGQGESNVHQKADISRTQKPDNRSRSNDRDFCRRHQAELLPKLTSRRLVKSSNGMVEPQPDHCPKDDDEFSKVEVATNKFAVKHKSTLGTLVHEKNTGQGSANLPVVPDGTMKANKPTRKSRPKPKQTKDSRFDGNLLAQTGMRPRRSLSQLPRSEFHSTQRVVKPEAQLFHAFRQKVQTNQSVIQKAQIFNQESHLKLPDEVATTTSIEANDSAQILRDKEASYYKWSVQEHETAKGSGIPRNDEALFTGDSTFKQPNQDPQFIFNATTAQTHETPSDQALNVPIAVRCLCSEAFLETNSAIVAELATGTWDGQHHASRNRCLALVDTPLLDRCKVDIETPDQRGILVFSASQMDSPEGVKETIYHLVELAAFRRYEQITVFVSLDAATSELFPVYLAKVHCAISSQIECTVSSKVAVVSLPPEKVSAGIANLALLTRKPAPDQAMLDHEATELAALPSLLAIERATFLLDLLPSLSAYGALQCLILADQLSPQDSAGFMMLFTSKMLRQRLIIQTTNKQIGIAINPSAIAHLSKLLETVL